MDFYDKDPKSGLHDLKSTLWTVSVLAVAMAFYAYFRLSPAGTSDRAIAVVFIALQLTITIISYTEDKSKWNVGFGVVFMIVFVSVMMGAYSTSLAEHPILMFSTIFYRPEYMKVGNRKVAFVLALLIAFAVLPATCGLVTDSGFVELLFMLYLLFVLCLWIFCARVGLAVTE